MIIADVGGRILHPEAFLQGGGARERRIVPAGHARPHRGQRAHRRKPGTPQSHHRVAAPGKQIGRKSAHRIFSVARPTRARIIETIQKRITIVGSAQPFFSK